MAYPAYKGPDWNNEQAQQFYSRADRSGECWIWTGSKTPRGYGNISLPGGQQYAHRVSYAISKGAIPEGKVVTHSCDNPTCINPRHLILGTQSENCQQREDRKRRDPDMRDRIRVRNEQIAKEYNAGATLRDLALRFSLSVPTVWHIMKSSGEELRPAGRPKC